MAKRAVALVLSAVLAGCASQMKTSGTRVAELERTLPGVYQSVPVAQASARDSVLYVVPVYAPALGDHVFYLQEVLADGSRRILSQRLISLEPSKGGIVQSNWVFVDAGRWRDGHIHTDLFKGMVRDDVRLTLRTEIGPGVIDGPGLAFGADGELVGADLPALQRFRKN